MRRVLLEKLATVQMLNVHIPTTDGRELLLARRIEPEADVRLLLQQLGLAFPTQPPPRIRCRARYGPGFSPRLRSRKSSNLFMAINSHPMAWLRALSVFNVFSSDSTCARYDNSEVRLVIFLSDLDAVMRSFGEAKAGKTDFPLRRP